MADRNELIEDITNAEITIQSNGQVVTICLGESVATAMVDQGGIDLGGGRRIAIVEETRMLCNDCGGVGVWEDGYEPGMSGGSCRRCDGAGMVVGPRRIVTPNPEEATDG